jgi:hypothetical protein
VTISLRRFSPIAFLLSASSRRNSLAACFALVLTVALMGSVAPAGAVVTTVEGTSVGLQPRDAETIFDGSLEGNSLGEVKYFPAPQTFANAAGNPVLHKSESFAIYWDPSDRYHGDWQNIIDTFFQNVGSESGSLGNDFAVDAQYTDKSNVPAYYRSTYRAAYTDTADYPVAGCKDPDPLIEYLPFKTKPLTCLTDQQVREHLQSFVAQHNLPKGMGAIYYLLTPPGVAVCLDGAATHCSDYEGASNAPSYKRSFCSYHSDINPGGTTTGDGNTVLYAVIPWTAGGDGDGQLNEFDQKTAYDCQDGGFDPSASETKEHEKQRNAKEIEEYEGESKEEKLISDKNLELENPHEEEPNQVPCPSTDGYCDAGLADLIIGQIGIEQQNIVTNPLLNAWQDASNNEATDECRNFFGSGKIEGSSSAEPGSLAGTLANQQIGSGKYYLNNAFDLAALKLVYPGVACLAGVSLAPQFTVPTIVKTGEVVGFDGMESNISLNAGTRYSSGGTPEANYATYTWNFGDGSPEVSGFAPGAPACEVPWLSPCAASEFHSYTYGGTYEVKLTVTDVGGNVSSTVHTVTVDGPPPPVVGSGPGASGSGGPGSSSGAPGTPGVVIVPNPVAAASVISQSLKSVLRSGLVIRYSVNEQVAGHFDVLLDRATARRLKITGTPAVNLPAGTPPELVIAKAILVTTKGGRSAVRIKFSKRTAARLAHTHKVKLTLRLIVRNASPTSPASTTVLSSFTLSH